MIALSVDRWGHRRMCPQVWSTRDQECREHSWDICSLIVKSSQRQQGSYRDEWKMRARGERCRLDTAFQSRLLLPLAACLHFYSTHHAVCSALFPPAVYPSQWLKEILLYLESIIFGSPAVLSVICTHDLTPGKVIWTWDNHVLELS